MIWTLLSLGSICFMLYIFYVAWERQQERDRVQERIARATEELARKKDE